MAPGCADGGEEIVERSGTRLSRCGGGKGVVGRSGTRIRRWRRRDSREKWLQVEQMWRRKRVSRKEWHQDAQIEEKR